MESTQQHINKFREERIAKEKARIEKLRELNLKKYSKQNFSKPISVSSVSLPVKTKSDTSIATNIKTNPANNNVYGSISNRKSIYAAKRVENKDVAVTKNVKNNFVANKIPINVNTNRNKCNTETKLNKPATTNTRINKPLKEMPTASNVKTINPNNISKTVQNHKNNNVTVTSKFNSKLKTLDEEKNHQNKVMQQNIEKPPKTNGESVFDRLYKPKVVQKQSIDNALRLQTDPNYLKKVIKDSRLIMNKRHTMCNNSKPALPVRRSISAVHFKRISKNELQNCMHKWASIGEKINKAHLKDINEDEGVKEERVISAIKSERKKVKFQTPIHLNFNTPKPEELQARLQKWLQKRGKSIDSYHHLQCFGLHHLSRDTRQFTLFDDDDENKENVAVNNDSDNDSYLDNMNNVNGNKKEENNAFPTDKWRRASVVSDSVDFNDSYETTLNSDGVHQVDELLLGALNDLTELLKEGFDWEQCARWLRAIRDRYPLAPDKAAYWECRAALEERRGDLPASVQCWEQAIAAGTEQSVVEANLDNLLDKFMQLKISPSSGKKHVDPKLVDVKNVFKSTIIRFAVQQAKLRQSNDSLKYTVTPVRRSSRLSTHRTHTPLLCASINQAAGMGAQFKPNKALVDSP
ncbi:unnamed protein product, partial [Brenthis ino]